MIEIGFTIGTIFEIILLPIVLFASVKRAYCLALFLTVFNRMAFLNIQGNSILVDQVFTLILIIRLLLCRLKIKFCLPKSLLFFVFYAGISIFFAPFYGDTYVISVDGIYSPVSFSIQQLTQYAYLLYAVFFMIITSNMLLMNKVTVDEILNVLDISYFIVIILGILQLFVPIKIFDFIFKNSLISIFSQKINGMYRIDSVFGEPSMLSLFMAPLFCRHLYKVLFEKFSWKSILAVLLGSLVVLENRSSSFVLGCIVAVFLFLFLFFVNIKMENIRITRKRFFEIICIIFVGIFIFSIFEKEFMELLDLLISKFKEKNKSGFERTFSAKLHIDVFLHHMLTGVGFGTLRGTDLITNWLAEEGIIGFSFYVCSVIVICFRLIKKKTILAREIFIMILVHNAVMMVSVPEFCFVYIWVYYALGWYLVNEEKIKNNLVPNIKEI